MRDILSRMLEMMHDGEPGVLVTILEVGGSVPRHPGSKMIVCRDGRIWGSIGGGRLEKDVIEEALPRLSDQAPWRKSFKLEKDLGMLCGGMVELLFEPFGAPERLLIFGGGHIGQALAPLAVQAGFSVVVIDDRPEFANRDRFPQADTVVAASYPEALAGLTLRESDYIVIMTHGHDHDELVLEYCLSRPSRYLGMIGSTRKTRRIFDSLIEKGAEPERIQGVHSPIGLDIGAETPFEIALSILAEVVAVRKGAVHTGQSMKLE